MDVFKDMDLDQPAFPTWRSNKDMKEGMTLRDYFAIHASDDDITNFLYTEEWDSNSGNYIRRDRESARYAFADAMLKSREKNHE